MSENEKQASVPYFVHEGTVARMERMFRLTPPTSLLWTGPTTLATTGNPTFSAKAANSSFEVETSSGTSGIPAHERI